jgi:UDP-N-acetylmuramoylalanine--D-glutamate ligase
MDASASFRGKKVTLMRIGLLGRGVGDAAFLASCGADVLVVDSAPQEVMQPSVDALKEFPNIRFKFGPYDLADFSTCDLVLKGSGTPLDSPEIAEAKKHGIPVRMSADLFMEVSGIQSIGVTGTRGKSTTTHMIATILEAAGDASKSLPRGKKVLLGGNVRGVSTLALLPEVTPEHVAVLELDSWQCQGLAEARRSPHIAVFTTFYPDHLNYYRGDLTAYLADKANIFRFQNQDDVLVLGSQAAELVKGKYSGGIFSRMEVVSAADLPSDWILTVPGEHNRYNGALALAAVRAYGVDDSISRRALGAFMGVPGRLELLREVGGVKIYNDNNSTTPEGTIAGLRALREDITLITGGSDKGLALDEFVAEIGTRVSHVVLLAHSNYKGSTLLAEKLREAKIPFEEASSLAEAFDKARAASTRGSILFSPAFASFGMFKNEYDRGDQFTALIKAL